MVDLGRGLLLQVTRRSCFTLLVHPLQDGAASIYHLTLAKRPTSGRLVPFKIWCTDISKSCGNLLLMTEFGAEADRKRKECRATSPNGAPMHLSMKAVYNIQKNVMGYPATSPMYVITIIRSLLRFRPTNLTHATQSSSASEWRKGR